MKSASSPRTSCAYSYQLHSTQTGFSRPWVAVWAAVLALLLLPGLGLAAAPAALWQVETLPTRSLAGGTSATLALATRSPLAPQHVLLFLSPYPSAMLKVTQGSTALALNVPWINAAAELHARGVAVAFADAPSDANKRGLANRPTSEIAADLRAAVQHLQQQFPAVPVHLAGFSVGAGALLDAASNVPELGRILIASGDFLDHRTTDWSRLKRPVLLIHAPSAQCDAAPFLEADLVARNNHFALLQAGYSQPEAKPSCGAASQHILSRLEPELADSVAHWLAGREPPASIGFATPQTAWREQLVNYSAPATFGSNRLEMTLLRPPGAGPFPVVIYNHGDIEIDTAWIRYQRRFVDYVVGREFLQLGWAVAFPSRPGIGLSEGNYKLFRNIDADATYKARMHAQNILPVFEYLKTNPDLDAQRILVIGQSAGGYAAMYLASLNLPGVVGAIDFSGGRTDMRGTAASSDLNAMMIRGFAEFGQTTRVPTLWVFAENDSRYTANTIRASYQAYVEAGGQATLSLSPPLEGDGHYIHHKPELWRPALRTYLATLKDPSHAP